MSKLTIQDHFSSIASQNGITPEIAEFIFNASIGHNKTITTNNFVDFANTVL